MIKISVIIPVYNAEKYISRCLDSVINQGYKDFEIICVEDKSKDNSIGILKKYALLDNRITIIENPENKGAALTRNVGLDIARGEYIYFIDADDCIDTKYLECMVNTIVLNLSIMTNSNPYKHPSMPEINKEGEYLDNISTIHNAPCFIWARMYKKEFLNRYNLRFLNTYVDDVVFNAIATMHTEKTFIFWSEKYHYTVKDEGMMANAQAQNSKDLNHIKAHSMIYDFLKERNKLDDRLKLFRVYPFMKVDTEEKFNYYKKFFEKIEADFHKNENIYNEMEKFFAYSLLNTSTYEEYLKNYNKIVTIGFLRRKK